MNIIRIEFCFEINCEKTPRLFYDPAASNGNCL